MKRVAGEQLRQVRVLHVVSEGGASAPMQSGLLLPLLTRMPKDRVKARVIALAPNAIPGAIVRQHGTPVHDVALSRRRFAFGAFAELNNITRVFRPDVIQAWGHTAQLVSLALRTRCEQPTRVVWSVSDTAPLPRHAGLIDRRKLRLTARFARHSDRLIFTSEAAAGLHRRAGYPEQGHQVITAGVDAARFKADAAARTRVRQSLELPENAFVVGMVAPFLPESDHATLIKAVGELVKTQPNMHLVLAGHGVQKGNAPLMALIGGGALATRVRLLGEWSDVASLFNACDVVCSSALSDSSRLTLVKAMLCGVPCVATGMGAQGEVIGQFGVAVEPGNPQAFVRGIQRILELTEERRAFLVQGARKQALQKFVLVSSLQKYLQLYQELVGREVLLTQQAHNEAEDDEDAESVPAVIAPIKVPISSAPAAVAAAVSSKVVQEPVRRDAVVPTAELADPDSLETRAEPPPPEPALESDVLATFESEMASGRFVTVDASADRARGVAEELEDLLAPEVLQVPAPEPDATQAERTADEPLQLQLVPDDVLLEPKQVSTS